MKVKHLTFVLVPALLTALCLADSGKPVIKKPQAIPSSKKNTTPPAQRSRLTTHNSQLTTVQTGSVLLVNDDAITSAQVIALLRKQQNDWPDEMEQQQFFRKALPLVSNLVMEKVYILLLYQHAKRGLDKLDISEDALEKILAEKRKEFLAEYGGSEARAQTILAQEGSSIEEIMEEEKRQIIISGFQELNFAPSLTITRSQMLKYYRAIKRMIFT